MGVKIGHARIDEKGRAKNGKAGDQTKKEVMISDWYDGNWHTVFRAKNSKQAEKIAKCCEMGCANNHIGYDQNQRTTLYEAAKPYGFDVSKVTKDVETDCSAFVSVCCNYAGIKVSAHNWTGEQKEILKKTGAFEILTDAKYTKSSDYLKRGDILLKDGHTAMVITDGAKVNKKTATKKETTTYKTTVDKMYTLNKACTIYSKPDLTGIKYVYKKGTTLTVTKHVNKTVDKIKVRVTGRVGYIKVSDLV